MNTSPVIDELLTPAFQLIQIELYNWGPFAGIHRAEINTDGTAIIGQTGSGKTTLVDAFMTLITANPKYNLASTGGHESDRDLISYVRGVSGAGSENSNDHIARPGKTLAGISANFSDLKSDVRITGLFWVDSSSSSTVDLKRCWIFSSTNKYSLIDWLELVQSGGMRALKQLGREEENIKVYDNKKSYLAQLRRYFEVNQNAFTLLNRAAGLKQLNSIDELFRELVLDDHSAFKRAAEVVAEFDDLAYIHSELETARKQRDSLLPIKSEAEQYHKNTEALAKHQTLQNSLATWFATHAHRLWAETEKNAELELNQVRVVLEELVEHHSIAKNQVDRLLAIYMQAGGNSIEQLKAQLQQTDAFLNERKRNANDYVQLTKSLELNDRIDAPSLAKNHVLAEQMHQESNEAYKITEGIAWEIGVIARQKRIELNEILDEIQRVKNSPGSNIPGKYHEFRSELAEALDISEDELAFVAELVEVKKEQAQWQGAIERAIGSHRLRLFVPADLMDKALTWVNNRNNRLHVRLYEATAPKEPSIFLADGFVKKLNFKSHSHRESLKALLANIDRHCVGSPEALKGVQYGMTMQGLMSGKQGFFEKQDQRPLDRDWMTGFDNKNRLANLATEFTTKEAETDEFDTKHKQKKEQCKQIEQKITLIVRLMNLQFSEIDFNSMDTQRENLQKQITALTSPDSDAEKNRLQWEASTEEFNKLQDKINEKNITISRWEDKIQDARLNKDKTYKRIGDGLTDKQQALADEYFTTPKLDELLQLSDIERVGNEKLLNTVLKLKDSVNLNEQRLIKFMVKAQEIDTGALSEVGTELGDIGKYIQHLQILDEEALPEKLNRFLDYLNQSSDQGVTQLLRNIETQVAKIEERIEELNQTMRRVDFQPDSFLRLDPHKVVHESLTTLQKAQRYLRTAALKEDEGESHYKALVNIVNLLRDATDRKKTVSAKALLDPRFRLQFSVSVINRNTAEIIETRTGSQGGSGGEKEIIASYILTASLSYALCPAGQSKPLFSTIILDEAFSKSSRAVAARIISALREFGLHPLFITPNKEIRLLRDHTNSAILIHRRGVKATMTSLSWTEWDEFAKKRRENHAYETTH